MKNLVLMALIGVVLAVLIHLLVVVSDQQAEDAADRALMKIPKVEPYVPAPVPPLVPSPTPPPDKKVSAPPVEIDGLPAVIAKDPDVQRWPDGAVMLDDKMLRNGFGPAIRFKTLPDGSIVRN